MLLTVELCSKQAVLTNNLVLARHNNLVHTQIVHMHSSKLIINARLLLITHVNLPTSTLCMISFVAMHTCMCLC